MGLDRTKRNRRGARAGFSLNKRRLLLGAGVLAGGAGVAYLAKSFQPKPAKLDLSQYELTFSEEFNAPDFSLDEFFKRWYPHTPWHGDFGDAAFADPQPEAPFTVSNGNLRIEASKDPAGKWHSGLIASVQPDGQGFSQRYGYFEVRVKLPPGPGVWPAFWLDSMVPKGINDPSVEVDVFEYYGQFPEYYHSTVIVWPAGGGKNHSVSTMTKVEAGTLSNEFHVFGVSVEPDWIVVFLDGSETWRTPTPAEHKHELMILLDLALGSGWPIDKTLNPSYMYIDYVRAYKLKGR